MLVWALAAFGGAYPWTLVPLVFLTVAAWALVRPRLFDRQHWLDAGLLGALVATILQAIPVSGTLRHLLSPRADEAWARTHLAGPATMGARALSLDASATLTWLPAGAMAIALFWIARRLFQSGDVRRLTRAIAWIGLVVSPLAIAQAYSAPGLLYWTLRPLDRGGAVFGPFVNRNHMATWLLLALPTVVGYIAARTAARDTRGRRLTALVDTLEEPKTFWLIAAAIAMFAALITSRSRAGLVGIAAAGAFAAIGPRAAGKRADGRWVLAIAAVALAVAAGLANTGATLARFGNVGGDSDLKRPAIWRQTARIIEDFPLTGVGVGAYEAAMLGYQQQRQYGFFYNQAHNQYLQFAAEGGLLVGLPIVIAIGAFAAAATRAARTDQSPLFWLRIGACAALAGVAVQSIWETGLRMPANALLCAVVAAIAVSDRHD